MQLLLLLHSALASDIIGEVYSPSIEGEGTQAIAYGVASVSKYTIEDSENWMKPKIVQELNLHNKNEQGKSSQAEALPSERQYYDGSGKVASGGIRCRLLVNKSSCMAHSGCGWCLSSSTCIPGSPEGALVPCQRDSYLYDY